MKKLVVFAVLVTAAYYAYLHLSSPPGAFDSEGNPLTLVFTMDKCPPCDKAVQFMQHRKIEFEEINISSGPEARDRLNKYGGRQFPLVVMGDQQYTGYQKNELVSFAAQSLGWDILKRHEEMAMLEHFDDNGDPIVVMYSTERCSYCKLAHNYFVENGIDYQKLDIETSTKAEQGYNTLEGAGTPLIYIGFYRIDGFNKNKIDHAIKEYLN
jgi:glutaredoxin